MQNMSEMILKSSWRFYVQFLIGITVTLVTVRSQHYSSSYNQPVSFFQRQQISPNPPWNTQKFSGRSPQYYQHGTSNPMANRRHENSFRFPGQSGIVATLEGQNTQRFGFSQNLESGLRHDINAAETRNDDSGYSRQNSQRFGFPQNLESRLRPDTSAAETRNDGFGNSRQTSQSFGFPQNLEPRSRHDIIAAETRNDNSGRFISDTAFSRITETLGAINTVGHYLVDMVSDDSSSNSKEDETDPTLQQLPNAIYTISKNVLGRNVTDKIAPIVRKALPKVLPDSPLSKVTTSGASSPHVANLQSAEACTTPEGDEGICDDLSNCPQLLLNLGTLRESLCFKSSFVPGVCCPLNSLENNTVSTTSKPTYLLPVTTTAKPTKKPSTILVLTTAKPTPIKTPASTVLKPTTTTGIPSTVLTFTTVAPPQLVNLSNIVNIEECGQREDESGRIVGGVQAKSGAWPWMAAIFLHGAKRREFWCGGSLIGPRHILTAAHCTRDSKQRPFPARQFTVRLGDVDLASDDEPSKPVTYRVAQVRAHQDFSRVGFYNDVAILVLSDSVQKSKYAIPICVPSPEDARETFAGSRATVVGWGTTRYGGSESSVQLQASLPIWRNNDCDRAYFQPITNNFICAGVAEGGTDACQGDSGGPLMLQVRGRWTQIGVVSFGNKCGEPGYPGVYTRMTHYIDWIKENMP